MAGLGHRSVAATGTTTWKQRSSGTESGRSTSPSSTSAAGRSSARFDPAVGETPDRWFHAAVERGVAAELDAVCLRSALDHAPDLPANCFMTVNVEPDSLASPAVESVFDDHGSLAGLVVEVTEHSAADPDAMAPMLDRLRDAGALIAVDDAGSGYAGLQQILSLRPSLIKIDRALISGVDTDESKAVLVEMLGVLSDRLDAWLLAEGVETLGEANRLSTMGVPLAQGYLFARPAAPWAGLDPSVRAGMESFADQPSTTLHRLLEYVPIIIGDDQLLGSGGPAHARCWRVTVDEDQRPQGLLPPATARPGEIVAALTANVTSSPRELASRVSTGNFDPALPVLVTDNAGRYVGTVSIRRLLAHLATAPS